MKKKSSRIVALVLTLCMVFFGLPVTAMAEGRLPSADNGVIKLTEDVSVATLPLEESGETVYDLNGHNLTYTGTSTITLSDGQTLTFKDSSASGTTRGGTLTLSGITGGVKSGIKPETGATVNAQNIKVVAPHCSAFFPRGDASAVNITNCDVTADVYCVGTNAATTDNYNVVITLKNSTFTATGTTYPGDDCPVMINVEGKLNVDNCIITGHRQGVMVRAGEAVIKNSSIKTLGTYSNKEQYYSSSWSSGTEVPAAALTVGNYYTAEAKAYFADANVTLINTSLTAENNFPALYMDGNTSYKTIVKLSGDSSVVSGAVMKGQQKSADAFSIEFTGGTFSTNVSDYVPRGYECKSSGNKWVVGLPDDTMIVTPETSEDGSASATLDGVYVGDNTSIATGGTDEGDTSAFGNVTDTGSVEIDLSTGTAATTSATLTVTNVAAASLSDAPSLTVKTKAGNVTLPKDALQKVAEAGEGGKDVTVTVTKENDISGNGIEAAYTVTVEANGKNLLPAAATDNGDITITVEKPVVSAGETLEAWYAVQNTSGDWLPVEELTYESDEGNNKLAITITHLSTVILYNTPQSSNVVATVKTSDNQTTSYTNLQTAIGAAGNGDTVTLWQDVVLDGTGKGNTKGLLTISGNKTITVEGKGHLISATNVSVSGNDGPSMINVVNGAKVTFRNLIIDGATTDNSGNTKHGLNIYQATATVENVTIKNNRWYAIVANGSDLTVDGLTTKDNQWGINVDNKSGNASLVVNEATIEEESSIVFDKGNATGNVPTGTIEDGDFQYIIFNENAKDTALTISGGTFGTDFSEVEGAVDISKHLADDVEWDSATGEVEDKTPSKPSSTTDDTPSPGYRLPYIGESTGGKNFVSDTTSNLTVNGKYQFRITSTDGHKPVMTVSNSNFTVELASQSGNDYFYVIRCAGAAGSTANVLVDGIHVVVATVGTAGVVSDTTHPFTVAQGAAYQFKLTSASRPTFTGNNANFTIAYVSNSGNDWFFKVTAAGAAGASTTFSANGVVVTTATIA